MDKSLTIVRRTTKEKNNLEFMKAILDILRTKKEAKSDEFAKLRGDVPLPSGGWERGDLIPDVYNHNSKMQSLQRCLVRMQKEYNSLAVAIEKKQNYDVCVCCGSLFCRREVMEHCKNTLKTPCVKCTKWG